MPEAVIQYPGIERIISATIPRGHGITPDCIDISFIPQQQRWKRTGPITITYGKHRIIMPDNLADEAHYTIGQQGNIWHLKLWDYRWRWRYDKAITGRYNVRLPDGPVDKLDPLTEMSMQKLFKMLLGKMKLPGRHDLLGKIPVIYPEINWNFSNPARELARLCDMTGHRIVAQYDGRVQLIPWSKDAKGATATLPKEFPIKDEAGSYDPPEAPEKYVYVCGSTKYQYTLPLEAVGDDIDGLIKPIDDLSYRPRLPDVNLREVKKPWGECDLLYFMDIPFTEDISKWYNLPNPRQLAQASIFRKYRLRICRSKNGKPDPAVPFIDLSNVGNVSKTIYIPGCPVTVKDIRQILPLGSELLEPVKTKEGWFKETPLIVWGQFCWGATRNNYEDDLADADKIPQMLAQGRDPRTGQLLPDSESTVVQPDDYQIDYETGIITINGPMNGRMCRLVQDGTRTRFEPARLWMRGTCQVKEYGVWVPIREEVEQSPPRGLDYVVGGKLYIEDKELFLRNVPVYNKDKISLKEITDNSKILKDEAKKRLDAELQRIQELKPVNSELAGIYPVKLDGGIHQVVYSISKAGAYTKVGLHNEFWVQTVTFEERRFLEKASDEQKNRAGDRERLRQQDTPFSRLSGVNRGR